MVVLLLIKMKFSSVNMTKSVGTADFVTPAGEILNEKLYFLGRD